MVYGHLRRWKQALSGVAIRNRGSAGTDEAIDQGLEGPEEESLVFMNRATEGAAELVALEGRDRLGCGVEKILRVQVGVAQELEQRAVELVAARAGHGVDNAPRLAPKLGPIPVRQNLELQHRFHPE